MTEKVLAERAVQRAAAEAANSARSQFLTNVSHKLRTPLDAILGFSEVLENGTAGPLQSRQAEYVGLIRESSDHLSRVINEMLDLARIDGGNLDLNEEVLEPRELVDSAMALVRDRAAAGLLKLAVDIEEHMAPLLADRTRLMEILLTLLANAIKRTELGGAIKRRLSLSLDDLCQMPARTQVVRSNARVRCRSHARSRSRVRWPAMSFLPGR